jgi:patatin-like phospholipase/acyl hydrolase
LSLDGGGVRGLSSLLILKDVMTQLNLEREASEVLRPCDVFDLIGGTSTGGCVLQKTTELANAALTYHNPFID